MGRPKLDKKDHKIHLSITLETQIYEKLCKISKNKSKFIENLLKNHLK